MKKSLRKTNFNRLKIRKPLIHKDSYRPKSPYRLPKNRGKEFYKKTLRQVGLCVVVVLLVILIKNINTPITNKTQDLLKTSLSQEFNFKTSFKKVLNYAKETPNVADKVISVFTNQESTKKISMSMTPPVNGEIVSFFGEKEDPILNQKTFQRGLDISVSENQKVKSIAKGEVVEVGQGNSLGKYIKIKHNEDFFAIYGNCKEIDVQIGEIVTLGQPVAKVYSTIDGNNKPFHFELWVEGNVVDPIEYIQFDKKAL